MYQHMILMCSDYTLERRIALYKTYEEVLSMLDFQSIIDEIEGDFKNIEFSFHHIETEDVCISSVEKYDSYFEDVEFCSDKLEFIKKVEKSIEVTPVDIAKYILTQKDFDQLQIQKLIYLVYYEYSKSHDVEIFKDKFEAWKYGPVIPSLYDKIYKYNREKIRLDDKGMERLKVNLKLSKFSHKKDLIDCIDTVIKKYGKKSGGQLIDLTHKKGSPWDKIYNDGKGYGDEIPSKLIREYAIHEA